MNVNWTLFANLYSAFVTPLIAQMQAMIGGVCATMQPVALAMVTLWLAFVGIDIANGSRTFQQAMRDFFIAGMVIGALQTGQYTQYVSDFFLQAVPHTLGAALGGTTSPVAGLDTVLDSALTTGSKTYEALPNYSLKTIPLALAVIVYVVVALVAVGYAFAVYMTAAIINVAVIVVGPVFLALAAIPATRRFAAGWLGVVVGGCVTQLMAVAVILFLTNAENTMIQQTVGPVAANNSNSLGLLWGLAQCGILLALCTAVVKKIPAIAQEIAGGVYHGTAGAHSATFGLLGLGARAAASGAGVAGQAMTQLRAARSSTGGMAGGGRPTAPTGPSLSGIA
jgi:type IV secretory pathway VirB6-like protein